MEYFIIIVSCYIVGSLNPAYIIGRLFHNVDIREVNSKNAGTSNVWMTFGKRKGVTVAVLDILKGLVPVLVLRLLFKDNDVLWVLGGLSAMIGHVYPFYLKFKGGKGTATFGGVVIALFPLLSIPLAVLFFLALWVTDYIALSTLLVVVLVPVLMLIFDYSYLSIILMCVYTLLSIYKHMPNFIRIIKKQEKGFKGTLPSIKEDKKKD